MRRLRAPKRALIQTLRTAVSEKSQTGTARRSSAARCIPETRNSRAEILSVRTGADRGSTSAVGEAIFAPASKPAMQGWGTLVVQPPIGEDGELVEPEAPADTRSPLPALPARAELRDAEVHALLGELDAGERLQTGDATAEELQALANFDIRAFA